MKIAFSKFFHSAASLAKRAALFIPKLIAAHPIITVAVVVAALVIGSGLYLYFGKGAGFGLPSPAGGPPVDADTSPDDTARETEPETDWSEIRILTILIEDDKVFVNDKEFKDAEELKQFLEDIYDDGKIVRLDDAQSILATRDWVVEVLNGLSISYTQAAA